MAGGSQRNWRHRSISPGHRSGGSTQRTDSRWVLAHRIAAALDPAAAPGKVRTLADMTPEEQAEMRRLYERNPEGA